MTAISPVEIPTHGEYAPNGCNINPNRSPKKQARNPGTAPKINPDNAENKIVSENCTSASLNSNSAFATTVNAVTTPTYATRFERGNIVTVFDIHNFSDIKNSPSREPLWELNTHSTRTCPSQICHSA